MNLTCFAFFRGITEARFVYVFVLGNGYSPGDVAMSDELLPEGVRACQRTPKASGQASEMALPCALPLKS